MDKIRLMTPGPTPVPEKIMRQMAEPIIHHRTPQFQEIIKSCQDGLKYVFQTKNDVLIFASSGTGAMEASVCNLLSAGDAAIAVSGGKFGERWAEICKAYGINTAVVDVEWGKAVSPARIAQELKKNPKAKAVYITQCETSTGALTDVKAVAEVVSNTEAVLVVDAISSLGSCRLKTDEWKVDVVVAGSQKGLMIPPGLAFMSVSEKAMKLVEQSTLPKYYFSVKAYKKAAAKTDTPYTPAITLMRGLACALDMIKQETIEAVLTRHERLAEQTRDAVKQLGLEHFAPTAPSNAVTPVKAPEGIDGAQIVKLLKSKHKIWVAGGQGHLKGKIFRVAHMGYMNEEDVKAAMSALADVLKELGYNSAGGCGATGGSRPAFGGAQV